MDQMKGTWDGFMLRDKLPRRCPACNAEPIYFKSERLPLVQGLSPNWNHNVGYSCGNSAFISDSPSCGGKLVFGKACKNAYDIVAERAERKEPYWTDKVLVQSSTDPEKYYLVQQGKDGHLGCDCPDFIYHGSGSPGYVCKHIKKALQALEDAELWDGRG